MRNGSFEKARRYYAMALLTMAVLTMATLTMAIVLTIATLTLAPSRKRSAALLALLTMALLTMALLTMALLTMTILTMVLTGQEPNPNPNPNPNPHLAMQEDIEAAIGAIMQRARLLPPGTAALLPLPLYAALPPAKQMQALRPAPAGVRKVILATNIAETSVTIDGVVYVVDAGLAKMRAFHAGKGIDSLLALPVSQAP